MRQVDLAERHRPVPKHSQASDAMAWGLSRQLHMAPAGALSDFRLPPGGAATWVHVIAGRKASISQHLASQAVADPQCTPCMRFSTMR